MDPTSSNDPQLVARAAATLEFLIKLGAIFGSVWAFVAKVAKPYTEWRRRHFAAQIRDILKPEIDRLNEIATREENCTDLQQRILDRQTVIFEDLALFLELVRDSHERHDETNDLLDQAFGLEQRVDLDKRRQIDAMLTQLRARHIRRRQGEIE